LKDVRRAVARGAMTAEGCWVAESFHLLREALRSELRIEAVLASQAAQAEVEELLRGRLEALLRIVDGRLFAQVAATETTQGVIALVRPPSWTLEDLLRGCPLIVVMDGVQDPGNGGAIVRSAEAFGASGVVFLKGSAGPANPKTLRASAGSLFRLPFVDGIGGNALRAQLRERGIQVLALSPRRGMPPADSNLVIPSALIVGSEAHGVSRVFEESAESVWIETHGVESLNSSTAAAIILYEASRQRATADQQAKGDK
jgi:TrmH family RNA methyltransferase